jgi:FkbM family methyltransferase
MEPKPLIAKRSRRAKITLVACATLFIVFLLLVFAHTNRPATVRAYFWAEQNLIEHWPPRWGKSAVEQVATHKLVGSLCRIGILGPARIQVEPGMSFLLDPRDLIAVSILRGGEWQSEIWEAISPVLSEGAVFLDVGAHIGYFSMKASARVGKTGHIVAFEPNPETLKLLRENVTANKTGNVTVEPIACTDREQTLTLWTSASFNTGMSSLARENADISYEEPPRPYTVRGRPIDDVVRELNLTKVNAIKVDVEGAELEVLRGAMKTLKRFHPKLVVEVDSRQLANFKTTPEDLVSVITGAGYKHGRPLNSGGTDWEWTE